MSYFNTLEKLEQSFALRALATPATRALFVEFLRVVFDNGLTTSVAEEDARYALAAIIKDARGGDPGLFSDNVSYIDVWCDREHRLLNRHLDGDSTSLSLTGHAETVLKFYLSAANEGGDVAVGVKLEALLRLIGDAADYVDQDRSRRIMRRQNEILQKEAEIKLLKANQEEKYDKDKASEYIRVAMASFVDILNDFGNLSGRLKALVRSTQERSIDGTMGRGQLVGAVLDENEEITNSPQGKSFGHMVSLLKNRLRMRSVEESLQILADLGQADSAPGMLRKLSTRARDSQSHLSVILRTLSRCIRGGGAAQNAEVRSLIDAIKREAKAVAGNAKGTAAITGGRGVAVSFWLPRLVVKTSSGRVIKEPKVDRPIMAASLADNSSGWEELAAALTDQQAFPESLALARIEALLVRDGVATLPALTTEYGCDVVPLELATYIVVGESRFSVSCDNCEEKLTINGASWLVPRLEIRRAK